MEKKQGDKQTEEQAADKPTESTASTSTGTSAKDTDTGAGKTSAASRSSGSSRASSRRSKRSKASSASSGSKAAPKAAQDEKTQSDKGQGGKGQGDKSQDDKPAAKSTTAGEQSSAQNKADAKAGAGDAGKGASTSAGKPSGDGASPRPGSAMPWLVAAVVLLFVLAGIGAWQLWQLDQARQAQVESTQADREELAARIDSLSGDIADTRASIDTLEQRDEAIRDEVESALSGQLDKLADRQDSLGERVARIDDRLARGEIAWKTAEVGFLLTRAQERLAIARDPHGAKLALELADERVAALSRPHWLPLRSAISDAIASIEDASEGDRVGQALALRRLGDRVDEWPLAGRDAPADEEATGETSAAAPAAPADAAWYEKAWAATTGWLTSQVSVTRSDRPVRLRERVATDRETRLWLTAVREALLSRDREALMTTLDESRDWIEAHYAVEASGPAAALEAIERVRTQFTSREFPSLEAVLRAWERASAQEKARADDTGKEAQS
ncbi:MULTISPECIES: uroporphyrinogen-III C-methyltransferase [unclassified Guyparkeria]|uniref:uroporphyrinogen-III C-methyltransferase n=1 Tax=unclassified Guyparkeria TaxID=2626246 RepID=UPI0007339462|nr:MULTISPECIES: uroporphyrinogen-III C-methyltransferase [unclassified Guyparkeria]KTG16751.1 hypothetical protein AUR63_01410 [Guyparkeria sp. XI15]OAE85785.1 hypothetical protein AWR35_01410 [Guyparkeria sp. WRN-7]